MERTVDSETGVEVSACADWDEFITAMRSAEGGFGLDRLYRG